MDRPRDAPERDQVEAAVAFATDLALRAQDALAGAKRTYERFGVVRVGNRLITRQQMAAMRAAQPSSEPPPATPDTETPA